MSTAHDDGAAAQDDHAHAFDGEPVRALPADEPRTPGWLPALGVLLFVSAGIAFLATSGDKAGEGAAPAKTTEAAPAEAPIKNITPVRPPQNQGQPTQPQLPAKPVPPGTVDSAVNRMSPEQIKDLQKRIDEARVKRGLPPLPAPTAKPAQAQ